MTGIYKIENTITKKVYVGQSIDIDRRIRQHRSLLKRLPDNYFLKEDAIEFGIGVFYFEALEECDKECLDDREKKWISHFKEIGEVYNKSIGGKGNKGYRHSEESKKLISRNHSHYWKGKKRPLTEETIRKISESHKGRHYTPSEKQLNHLRTVNIGRKRSEEFKEKIRERNAILAKHFSEVNKGKIFITDGTNDKTIRKEELERYEAEGWKKGRTKKQDYSKRRPRCKKNTR